MKTWTLEELHIEHEKIVLGLQYTIAERERLKVLLKMIGDAIDRGVTADFALIIKCLLSSPAERCGDIFALLLNEGIRDGFFVEFGACDGVAVSNTLSLERYFGWKGILAEPDVFWKDSLPKNRSASIDSRAVSSETGLKLEFFQSARPGNSSPDRGHAYIGEIVDSYTVETVSLMDLLRDHEAPNFIHFLSVDTEGHEKEVFNNFDFDKYRFGFISVEEHAEVSPRDSVQPLLEAAGYRIVFPRETGRPIPMQVTGIDKFFVPRNHPAAQKWS